MINLRVLIIATYPIVLPQHGGQKRVRALYDQYVNIFSDVKFVGIYVKDQYQKDEIGKDDLFVAQPEVMKKINERPFLIDVLSGQAIDNDIHVRSPFAKILFDYKPDIIQIEQVYPYFGLEKLLSEIGIHARMINSSHNIEYQMKEQIYKTIGIPTEECLKLVNQIKETERQLARQADFSIAVSKSDATELRSLGAKKVVVANNGIYKNVLTQAASQYWAKFKEKHDIDHLIIFIASGHILNWTGFINMVGDELNFLGEGSKIVIAGGLSDHIKSLYKTDSVKGKEFYSKVMVVGKLEEEMLTGLIESSEVILLPITEGGGSNLKTAEAILSGKKIVATSHAFRSFERYMKQLDTYIADTRKEFQVAIVEAISKKTNQRRFWQKALDNKVQWKYCLKHLKRQLYILAVKTHFSILKAKIRRHLRNLVKT